MKNSSAYCLKNGILYINGKASFGIGSHYYPSYHPHKVPVPEDGDRLGEMKRDFALPQSLEFCGNTLPTT